MVKKMDEKKELSQQELEALEAEEKRARREKNSYMFRVLGAVYLFYVSYSLISGMIKGSSEVEVVPIIASIAFIVCGILFIYSAWKGYRKYKILEAEKPKEVIKKPAAEAEKKTGSIAEKANLVQKMEEESED